MTARNATLALAALAIALVFAQDLIPSAPLYHTWQYALALTIALAVMVAHANGVRRGRDGVAGRGLLLAFGGAAVVVVAGLAAGLLGPDTVLVVGTPGTLKSLPALGGAAFFAPVDANELARGSSVVTLRRGGREIVVGPGTRRPIGESLLYLDAHPAAYIDAADAGGAHVTLTQPTNASFLSPVLLFREHQRIGAFDVPLDTFATPALHRIVRVLYFTPRQLAQLAHPGADATRPAVIFTASDEAGKPLGITLAASGQTVSLAGLRLRATLGSYPALAVAAAPPPWALSLGIALFVGGIAWSALSGRAGARAPVPRQPQSA